MSPPTSAPPRVGFLMEQVLGHVTHYRTLHALLADNPGVAPHWVEVSYTGNGRLERLSVLPGALRSTLRGFLQVREGLRGQRFDALFFHTQKPAVFQWDWLARVPTVLSLDVTPRQYDALGEFYDHAPDGGTPVAWLKHQINRRTFALAARIVAWSNWVRDSLVADYGVPPAKIQVVPPGVDLELWQPSPSSARAEQLPRVLFVGGDFERKGGHLLLDWFRQSGRGRCELDLVTRAAVAPEPGVRVHRTIVGNSAEARRLYSEADIFVLPSLGECFGIASVEAMAVGLPVIATLVGGAVDIVQDGETGLLIPSANRSALAIALERLVGDIPLRERMGRQGRLRAEHLFDARRNAETLVACLREAAAGPIPAQAAASRDRTAVADSLRARCSL